MTAGVEGGNVRRINKLPWRYVKELHDYWADEPPVHIMLLRVARALGMRSSTRKPELNDFERVLVGFAERPSEISAGMKTLDQLPSNVADWIREAARSTDARN